jgi:hypothetical protein
LAKPADLKRPAAFILTKRIGPKPVRFFVRRNIKVSGAGTLPPACALSVRNGGPVMLVERGLRVMNVEAVGDAYAIASNYLRKTGAIADTFVTNDALLEIIVQMFHRGEYNKLRLANKAISQFEASRRV